MSTNYSGSKIATRSSGGFPTSSSINVEQRQTRQPTKLQNRSSPVTGTSTINQQKSPENGQEDFMVSASPDYTSGKPNRKNNEGVAHKITKMADFSVFTQAKKFLNENQIRHTSADNFRLRSGGKNKPAEENLESSDAGSPSPTKSKQKQNAQGNEQDHKEYMMSSEKPSRKFKVNHQKPNGMQKRTVNLRSATSSHVLSVQKQQISQSAIKPITSHNSEGKLTNIKITQSNRTTVKQVIPESIEHTRVIKIGGRQILTNTKNTKQTFSLKKTNAIVNQKLTTLRDTIAENNKVDSVKKPVLKVKSRRRDTSEDPIQLKTKPLESQGKGVILRRLRVVSPTKTLEAQNDKLQSSTLKKETIILRRDQIKIMSPPTNVKQQDKANLAIDKYFSQQKPAKQITIKAQTEASVQGIQSVQTNKARPCSSYYMNQQKDIKTEDSSLPDPTKKQRSLQIQIPESPNRSTDERSPMGSSSGSPTANVSMQVIQKVPLTVKENNKQFLFQPSTEQKNSKVQVIPKPVKVQSTKNLANRGQAFFGSGNNVSSQSEQKPTPLKTSKSAQQLNACKDLPLQPEAKVILPAGIPMDPTKTSTKRNGLVRAYAANTYQGLVRNYNEDRVAIVLNIMQPPAKKVHSTKAANQKQFQFGSGSHQRNSSLCKEIEKDSPVIAQEPWPRCSFFGIYDGHGGATCADFLRDNLHKMVIQQDCFPKDPREALKRGFAKAERRWMEQHALHTDQDKTNLTLGKQESTKQQDHLKDKSGSCAIVSLIVGDMCYVANVGDSRAVLSGQQGQRVFPLSRDHKPDDEHEQKRIVAAGGHIYHRTTVNGKLTATVVQSTNGTVTNSVPQALKDNSPVRKPDANEDVVQGPLRVFPGRLSVCRTFGDVEAKMRRFGGNPNVVVCVPEIKAFKIEENEHDFVLLGCDGIFDRLNNKECVQAVWNSVQDNRDSNCKMAKTVHKQAGQGAQYVLKNALLRRTLDNITVVLIAFKNFKESLFDGIQQKQEVKKDPENVDPQIVITAPNAKERGQQLSVKSASGKPIEPTKQFSSGPIAGLSQAKSENKLPSHSKPPTCKNKKPRMFDFTSLA